MLWRRRGRHKPYTQPMPRHAASDGATRKRKHCPQARRKENDHAPGHALRKWHPPKLQCFALMVVSLQNSLRFSGGKGVARQPDLNQTARRCQFCVCGLRELHVLDLDVGTRDQSFEFVPLRGTEERTEERRNVGDPFDRVDLAWERPAVRRECLAAGSRNFGHRRSWLPPFPLGRMDLGRKKASSRGNGWRRCRASPPILRYCAAMPRFLQRRENTTGLRRCTSDP